MIQNPVLPGFNPDPSMLRVGDDYYIATSSFEWFPGVPLYHSRDLVNWRLVRNLLETKESLDLTGVLPSKGIWAPGLSYCEEEKRFYLVYSIVHTQNKWMFDVDNFLIWTLTEDVEGEWSKPLYLNSSGFDPYLFNDDDGRKWLVNKDRDFRPANIDERPIVIQEFDSKKGELIGTPVNISMGFTERSFTEGANIYKKDGWYYLFLSEGGTGYAHGITMGRSRSVTGPYEACPHNPIITSAPGEIKATEKEPFMLHKYYNPATKIQKSGHGSLVETQDGKWYMSHLCGRPVMPQLRCVLGRETSIQEVEWTEDGWLRMANNAPYALDEVPAPSLPSHPFPPVPTRHDFENGVLPAEFCTVRNEILPSWADLMPGKKGLKMRGRETLTSTFDISLLARRLTSFKTQSTTLLRFDPSHYHHMAGIACYYDMASHYYAFKTYDEKKDCAILSVYGYFEGQMREYNVAVEVPMEAPVYLRAKTDSADLQFFYSLDDKTYEPLGPVLDVTELSDEAVSPGLFTGAFVGMFVQDTHTKKKWAQFDYFEYLTEENM